MAATISLAALYSRYMMCDGQRPKALLSLSQRTQQKWAYNATERSLQCNAICHLFDSTVCRTIYSWHNVSVFWKIASVMPQFERGMRKYMMDENKLARSARQGLTDGTHKPKGILWNICMNKVAFYWRRLRGRFLPGNFRVHSVFSKYWKLCCLGDWQS